jgi:hypothetical protein
MLVYFFTCISCHVFYGVRFVHIQVLSLIYTVDIVCAASTLRKKGCLKCSGSLVCHTMFRFHARQLAALRVSLF